MLDKFLGRVEGSSERGAKQVKRQRECEGGEEIGLTIVETRWVRIVQVNGIVL